MQTNPVEFSGEKEVTRKEKNLRHSFQNPTGNE